LTRLLNYFTVVIKTTVLLLLSPHTDSFLSHLLIIPVTLVYAHCFVNVAASNNRKIINDEVGRVWQDAIVACFNWSF